MKGIEGFTVTAVPNEQDYVARLRIVLAVVLGVLLAAGVVGCSNTKEAKEAVPVDASPASKETRAAAQEGSAAGEGAPTSSEDTTSTTVIRSATSMGPGGSSVSSTTSPEQTLPTLPLRYAEETPLLKEVAPAYYAALIDFSNAGLALTPDAPELGNHIGGPELEVLRTFIRGNLFDGLIVVKRDEIQRWVRIEAATELSNGDVELEVCLQGNIETLFPDSGLQTDPGPFVPTRATETMHNEDGVWKWWGRTIAREDTAQNDSDCALP